MAVGDRVDIITNAEGTALISNIEERRNYIIRKSPNLSKQSHIIAANIDQAFLIVTINYPRTSTTFIDRFLASAEAYRIPVILIFNKRDALSDEELHYQQMVQDLYTSIGYECHVMSAKTGEGTDTLLPLMKDKISLFSGNSGVGKSTILNLYIKDKILKTAEISSAHKTGMHTTTFSEMLLLPNGGYVIDTPGIKGFGTFDIDSDELDSYFKEIFEYSKECRFNNCSHTHEPGCAVLEAVKQHLIAESRYTSYLSMLEDKNEDKYRPAY